MPHHRLVFVSAVLLICGALHAQETSTTHAPAEKDTLWVIPHTHWEGAVFKTREEYLDEGMEHIIHALRLLDQYPHYTFVLDQVAYVKPFLERYPEQEELFRKFVAQGRLQLVLGMDVMPDDNKPGGETFIRQIQYGKSYYRRKLGVDVKIAWLLDTFGHHSQIPQLLKLGGYTSFWFFRGVPRQDFPSEFLWEGIDRTQIPAFWEPYGYGDFYGSPGKIADFERYATERFNALNANAKDHDRVVYAGADVTDPEDQLPVMMEQAGRDEKLGFHIRFGVPTDFEAATLKRKDLPVFKGELNPIFQGTYSTRIDLKQWMRTSERLMTTAEKLAVISAALGHPVDRAAFWDAWEPILFNETHDLASGVMTDHVYEDTLRNFDFSKHAAGRMIDRSWDDLASAVDTQGPGTPIMVFNTLSWPRTDVVDVELGFAQQGVKGIEITTPDGKILPVQLLDAVRYQDGGIRQARVTFIAPNVPPLGYRVFHARPDGSKELTTPAPQPADKAEPALENDLCRVALDAATGAMKSVLLKNGNWEALSGPGNVISRQDDRGDAWEPYHGLDGGSRIAMTAKQPLPMPGKDHFSNEGKGVPGTVLKGPVFSEFSISRPFDTGHFATTVRLMAGSGRVDITTRLVNNTKFVRYQALFPVAVHDGQNIQSIPFGSVERPNGIEFPAQEWVDYSGAGHGVALLNVGLPGNLVSGNLMMLSLLRSQTLGGYVAGDQPDMTSNTGLELGRERTLHYALQPHNGNWRDAKVWQSGMEFAHPLLCRKALPHPGPLPASWAMLSVSNSNVVVTAVTPGRDNAAIVRLYEAAGQPSPAVALTFANQITSAAEVNLMEDHMADIKPDGKSLKVDLSPFQIKTLSVRLPRLTQ
jgi:alpha-mannosidase